MSNPNGPNGLLGIVVFLFMVFTAVFCGLWNYSQNENAELKTQLEQCTPQVSTVDINQPIVGSVLPDELPPFEVDPVEPKWRTR